MDDARLKTSVDRAAGWRNWRGRLGAAGLLSALAWCALFLCVWTIASDEQYQWDFGIYYRAAHALAAHQDPYAVRSAGSAMRGGASFQYPPLTLLGFRWTTWLSLPQARLVWLCMKLAALALLLRLWSREFERLDSRWPVTLFIALAFNATLLRDLVAGNISTFEQLLVWGAFALLLRGRMYLAAALLAVTAQFKLLPACLLLLIPLVRPRDGLRAALFGAALFLGLFALNAVSSGDLFPHYLAQFTAANLHLDERNLNNPSSLALFRDIVESTSIIPGLDYNITGGNWAYGCFAATLLLATLRTLWPLRGQRLQAVDPRLLVYLACALYTCLMPRMKDYSYVLMLIPALFVVRDLDRRGVTPNYLVLALALLALAQPQQTSVPGMSLALTLAQAYLPLLLAAAVLFYVLGVLTGSTSVGGERVRATRAART